MSVQSKILAACLVFVMIIAMVGGLAQQQAAQMGRLAISIYDHSFMGMSYVNQAQEEFLRLEAAEHDSTASLAGNVQLKKVLQLLDVALDRAVADRTLEAGKQTRGLLAALSDVPAQDLKEHLVQADRSMTKLVKKFAADGLETRDDAEELTAHSTRLILIQIAVAVCLAIGVGFLVGRNLSRPLVRLVRTIGELAAGNLDDVVPANLTERRDEIGALARTAGIFREAMQQNVRAVDERQRLQVKNEADKLAALRDAADSIERETTHVAERSAQSGAILAGRATELGAFAARMLASVDGATGASRDALNSCEVVAAAGEELSASAREISSQITASTIEIASTARAGEQAHQIIDALSASMGQISSVARLIGDIAGRTNLLALNATIEAARAGEAGRGFAVVASEVKSLATQTAQSTEDIARNVRHIQSATQDAVRVVGEMVTRVASIERITRAVAEAAEQQTAATGEIARSVMGTVEAMRVVSGQIGAVTEDAHHTGAAVDEMKLVAGTVADQISELRSVMVRIVRTSSDAANRRSDERVPVNMPAALIIEGRPTAITCLDLSLGGARISSSEVLVPGLTATLKLKGLPDLRGKLLRGGNDASINFEWNPKEAPPELFTWLGRSAA